MTSSQLERQSDTDKLAERALATITHDLKSPISAINGMASLLQQQCSVGTPIDENGREMLNRIVAASKTLSGLVDDIMVMAKLEAGYEKVEPVRVDNLHAELEEVLSTFEFEAVSKNIAINLTVAPGIPVVYWDIARLRCHALNNLVSNALRFAPHGGTVVISAYAIHDQVMLTVGDDGPGIPPEEREYIFGRLNQGGSARVFNGAGLGLYNTRLFVKRHGGSVKVEDQSMQEGTLFVISLPLDARPFIAG